MIEEFPPPQGRGGQAVLRVIVYLFGILACGLVASLALLPWLTPSFQDGQFSPEAIYSLPALAAFYIPYTLAVFFFTKYFVILIDRRPFETLGLQREGAWTRELWLGVILGIGMPGLIFAVSYLVGWTKITGTLFMEPTGRILAVLAQSLIAMIGVAITEEMIVRGYILQTLKWAYGAITALLVSSILFGVIHLANPNATFLGFAGTALAGIFLGYGYLLTGRLWLPIGWHFGWNFALAPLFGFPVSGIEIPSWIVQTTSGPTLLTGGRFGPEAGLLMPFTLILSAIILRLAFRHRPLTISH